MSEVARIEEAQPEKRWDELNLMEKLVAVDGLLPHDITDHIPRHLPLGQFKSGLEAAENIEHKGALWWGQLYKVGVEVYGQDFYQALTGFQYQKRTLQNYARLTDQIHPSLWGETIPDRHFMAIGQNITDPAEQKQWIEYVKERERKGTSITGDHLRDEIHTSLEQRGMRIPTRKANWHTCERCNGEGGWPEDDTPNDG